MAQHGRCLDVRTAQGQLEMQNFPTLRKLGGHQASKYLPINGYKIFLLQYVRVKYVSPPQEWVLIEKLRREVEKTAFRLETVWEKREYFFNHSLAERDLVQDDKNTSWDDLNTS